MSVPPTNRDDLIALARHTIDDGDRMIARHDVGLARAYYARASTLIQLAGYLGASEDSDRRWAAIDSVMAEDGHERECQDARISAIDEAHARDEATR